ncbi:uncharacterized protein PV09_05900 [Verruconis gallopava]|uniref:Prokaryotic-type class I peptide chain release factors domain-containing protein n=1 Tax=Verruconis gallopava TaxID=253628 RepID=A0A0D2AUL8_9PEZI|nr:uncharacterized protein PV09_05900 [Verruconis gallopava]KIW02844.1 hypothetical protein PV09_05900 [Verruconis gallopava]
MPSSTRIGMRWANLVTLSRKIRRWRSTAASSGEDEIAACRKWMASFNPDSIPKRLCDISFSRSSGPGGQNVNKVSSKATLRIELSSLLPLLPSLLHQPLRQSRYYAPNSNALVIQADDSRKQADNAHKCFVKLHRLITETAEKVIPGETSDEQKQRVKDLQRKENETRLRAKKYQSSKKASRRKTGWDE